MSTGSTLRYFGHDSRVGRAACGVQGGDREDDGEADPKVDAKTQETVQKDMDEMTLEPSKYPEISFQSTRVEPSGEEQWKVTGNLSLHGATKPVNLTVKRESGGYTGHTVLKQTDFGIKPISMAGGTIRIKNEIEIDFQIYAKRAQ